MSFARLKPFQVVAWPIDAVDLYAIYIDVRMALAGDVFAINVIGRPEPAFRRDLDIDAAFVIYFGRKVDADGDFRFDSTGLCRAVVT